MGRLKTDITHKVDEIITSNAILNTNFTDLQQDMEGLAGKVESKIQTMDGVGTKFNSFIEKVKYLETDNLKAKVDNLEKIVLHQSDNADANHVENVIKKFDSLENKSTNNRIDKMRL